MNFKQAEAILQSLNRSTRGRVITEVKSVDGTVQNTREEPTLMNLVHTATKEGFITVKMDGHFTEEELEAVLVLMRERKKQNEALDV